MIKPSHVEIDIRIGRLGDRDLLIKLEQQACGDTAWPNQSIGDSVHQPNVFILFAEVAGVDERTQSPDLKQPSGFLVWRRIVDEAEILTLGVTMPFRQIGVATKLLRAFEEQALSNHLTKALLEVNAGNTGALALYRAIGYDQIGRRKHYYRDGEDALTMIKTLIG